MGENPLIILPSKKSIDFKIASQFADLVKESDYKSEAKSIDDLKKEDWANRAIIVLGDEKSNGFYKEFSGKYPDNISIKGNELTIKNQKFTEEGNILLLNCANPKNPEKYASIIYCGNMANTEQFRRLFHYLSYSMVLVSQTKQGRPLSQMEIFPSAVDKNNMEYLFKK